MTSRHDELQERYQDALFALLMNEYVQKQGQKALEENERLKKSYEIELSQTFDKKIRRQIRHYWGVYKHKSGRKSLKKIVKHVGIVLCAAVMLTVTVFAAFPELKIKVMNLWLDITDKTAEFRFFDNSDSTEAIVPQDDFVVTWLPDGFYENEKTYMEDFIIEYKYLSDSLPEEEACITVTKILGDGTVTSIDTEDSEVRNVMVGNTNAIFTRKNGFNDISLTWRVEGENALMRIVALGISEEDLMKIAENIQT